MNWLFWCLIGYFVLSIIATVGVIGRPRQALTPQLAVWNILIYGGWIVLTIVGWPT